MQKRVYLINLSYNMVLARLLKGEKVYQGYTKGSNEAYIKYFSGFLISYNTQGGINVIGKELNIKDGGYYFLDEVEEPEADESCIEKLCCFWDKGDEKKILGFLEEIKIMESEDSKCPVYIDGFGQHWEHCRALTKEEALALIKE